MAEIEPKEYYKQNFRVTSEYGMRDGKMHRGVDLARQQGREGDPIISVNPGEVIFSGYGTDEGYYIKVKQDDGTIAKYLHLQEKPKLKAKERVERGAEIGRLGATGKGITGAHLHLSIEFEGAYLEPLEYLDYGLEGFMKIDTETTEGRRKYATQFFVDKGYTRQAAIGIVGNLIAESGLDPGARKIDERETSYGIAQWNSKGSPERVKKFKDIIGKNIENSSFEEQLEYVDWEIKNDEGTTVTHFFDKINDPNITEYDTAHLVAHHYERPLMKNRTPEKVQMRANYGKEAYEALSNEGMSKILGEEYRPEGWKFKKHGDEITGDLVYNPMESKYIAGQTQTNVGAELQADGIEESLEERLTSLENRDENVMFVEYIRGRDEREEREKSEKAAEEEKRAQASAAEKLLREETKKRNFLINFAMESLDYQAPEYRRVGNQQNREQNS